MNILFVVFRVSNEYDAAVLLESARFGVRRHDGVAMTPEELRRAVLSEIDEHGEWHPPAEEPGVEPVTWESFREAFREEHPDSWDRDAFYAWEELRARAVIEDEIDEDPPKVKAAPPKDTTP